MIAISLLLTLISTSFSIKNKEYAFFPLKILTFFRQKIIRASVDFDENRHVIDITDGEARHVAYTYSVNWIETEVTTPTIPTY